MVTITIEQLDKDGNVYRTFTRHCHKWDVKDVLRSIDRAFNMDATRVTVGK